MSWTILAPVVAAAVSVRALAGAWRRWRRDEATLTEALEEVGIAGLLLGIAAAAMAHPLIAGPFIALMGGTEVASIVKDRRLGTPPARSALAAPTEDEE